MLIYKRPRSPFYWADIQIEGKRHRFSTKRQSRAEARAVAEAWYKRRLDAGQLGDLPTLTLREALERYVSRLASSSDARNLKSRSRKLLDGYGARAHLDGGRPLHLLGRQDIDALVTARLREGNAEGTIQRELTVLSSAITYAARSGYQTPPGLTMPTFKTAQKLRYLSEDEEAALLRELWPLARREYQGRIAQAVTDAYDLVVALLDTGARYSEIAEITWEQVDTRNWRYLNIWRSKVGNAGTLALTPRLRTVLMWRYSARGNSFYVFAGYGRGHEPRGHATRAIMKAYDRAGINTPAKVKAHGKATVHSLRDTFASRLAQRGFPLQKLAQLLGHASIATTQKYAHLSDTQSADEAAALLAS